MPRFYHRLGALPATVTPPQLTDLPLDALRSQLYPGHPDAPDRIVAQSDKPLPIGLPQRMAFTRWKSGGLKAMWAENAKSYVSARDFGDQHSGVLVRAAGVPPVMLSPASFATSNGATALTVQTLDPDMRRAPVSRGYLPPDRYVTGADLDAFVANDETNRLMAQQTRNAGASAAMQEVKAVRSAIFDRMSPTGGTKPWYAR